SFKAGGNVQVAVNAGPQTIPAWATNISAGSTPSGQPLEFVVTDSDPSLFSNGPAIDAATGNLTFTPAAGASGSATISVALLDPGNKLQSPPQMFTIDVSSVPVAVADTYIISDSVSSTASAATGVLSNDIVIAGTTTAQLVSLPSHGTVVLNPDGSFTFTPNASFEGYDQFTYQDVAGGSSGPATTVTLLSQHAAVVDKLYHQVLDRPADLAGLQYWTTLIAQGQPYSVIASGIFLSDERLAPIVSRYYEQFLLRTPDAGGLSYWIGIWQQTGGPETVVAGMISSPEFMRQSAAAHPTLSPNAAWITTLYERLLNREPDPAGLQYWTSNLDSGAMTPPEVVLGFETSVEAYSNDVTGFFQQYLNRAPTASELSTYVAQLRAGSTQADIQDEIIDSPEYQQSPPLPQFGTMNRTTPL
ncbi:MAG: hypothetical protein B7Z73_17180, partial [Planctomycetia bacterium 21-64-5]